MLAMEFGVEVDDESSLYRSEPLEQILDPAEQMFNQKISRSSQTWLFELNSYSDLIDQNSSTLLNLV